ncbi:MAG: fasciclin domain-containing protein [Ginsengibacter sp.]
MKKIIIKKMAKQLLVIVVLAIAFSACNKKIPDAEPILFPSSSTLTIGDVLTSDTTYSFFKAAATKVGAMTALLNASNSFTLFLPDNNAFKASGIPSIQVINALPVATVFAIVNYHLIPGQVLPSDQIPTKFPNVQLPTALGPGSNLPGTIIPFKLSAFPSRRGTDFWYNIAPGLPSITMFSNGVINLVSKVTFPPSLTLAASSGPSVIYSDSLLSIFRALIVRGDSGQPAAARIDSALKNPGANLTVFAPNNTAMKQFISAATGGLIPTAAPDAVFIGFISTSFPVLNARGITVYHILGTRAFSVNFAAIPAFYPTLFNLGFPAHPGVSVQSFFTGLVVDSMKVTGFGNGGVAATSKPKSNFDKNAINGVVHVIDRVLLPQ